jgi:hypothetical protein
MANGNVVVEVTASTFTADVPSWPHQGRSTVTRFITTRGPGAWFIDAEARNPRQVYEDFSQQDVSDYTYRLLLQKMIEGTTGVTGFSQPPAVAIAPPPPPPSMNAVTAQQCQDVAANRRKWLTFDWIAIVNPEEALLDVAMMVRTALASSNHYLVMAALAKDINGKRDPDKLGAFRVVPRFSLLRDWDERHATVPIEFVHSYDAATLPAPVGRWLLAGWKAVVKFIKPPPPEEGPLPEDQVPADVPPPVQPEEGPLPEDQVPADVPPPPVQPEEGPLPEDQVPADVPPPVQPPPPPPLPIPPPLPESWYYHRLWVMIPEGENSWWRRWWPWWKPRFQFDDPAAATAIHAADRPLMIDFAKRAADLYEDCATNGFFPTNGRELARQPKIPWQLAYDDSFCDLLKR